MGWEYVLFDWEWDAMTNGGKLEDAVAYAKKKGIKTLMWYNSGGPHNTVGGTPRDRMLTHENRVKEFAWLKKDWLEPHLSTPHVDGGCLWR